MVRHLGVAVRLRAHVVADQVVGGGETRRLDHRFDRRADVTDVIAEPRRRHTGRQRLPRHVHQPLRLGVDRSHRHRDRGVGEVPLELHADIELHQVALLQHAPGRGYPVHDFLVDRRADGGREPIQSLERRLGAVM